MSKQNITEFLAAHADQLNRGEKLEARTLLSTFEVNRDEVGHLMTLATQLKRALKPTSIQALFRTHLRDGLEMAARHRTSQKILIERHDSAWGWVLGVAAIGSAAGLIAIAMRTKHARPIAQVVPETVQPN